MIELARVVILRLIPRWAHPFILSVVLFVIHNSRKNYCRAIYVIKAVIVFSISIPRKIYIRIRLFCKYIRDVLFEAVDNIKSKLQNRRLVSKLARELCLDRNFFRFNNKRGIELYNLKKLIENDDFYKPFLTYDKISKNLFINVDVGGIPGHMQENYLNRRDAAELLENGNINGIHFYYVDKWSLLPTQNFQEKQNLNFLIRFALKNPKQFFKIFGVFNR